MNPQSAMITTQIALDKALHQLSQCDVIALDTEFLREKTYYPKLCLIQIAGNGHHYAIDPIVGELDLSGLWALFQDESIMKVFHAGRQDLEIFYHLTGDLPRPIFDTQVAAMVCGLGDQIGYDKLVSHYLNKHIDKSSRFTDWSKRPLNDRQITYALDDVIYLAEIYPIMQKQLKKNKKERWIAEELAIITSKETYAIDPEESYKRIKIRSPKPQVLNRLKHLAAFRERECQKRDLPRGRFLKDETLMDLAATGPKNTDALAKIRGLNLQSNGWLSTNILKIIKQADEQDKSLWPDAPKRQPTERAPAAVLEVLRVLLKHVSDEEGVATRLIATAAELETLALSDDKSQPVLQGWRYDVFGAKALDMKSGKIAITLQEDKLYFHPLASLSE